LWNFELIESHRVTVRPDLQRIILGIDPSGTKGDGGDYIGIVVVGLGLDCSVKAVGSLLALSIDTPPTSSWLRRILAAAWLSN
jgi:phage terminase large subunit-like protein